MSKKYAAVIHKVYSTAPSQFSEFQDLSYQFSFFLGTVTLCYVSTQIKKLLLIIIIIRNISQTIISQKSSDHQSRRRRALM